VLTAAQMNEIGTNSNNYRVPPLCVVYLSTGTQPYTSNTDISWKAEFEDTDSMWAVGDPTKIYTTTAGLYHVSFSGQLASGGGSFSADGSFTTIKRSGTAQSRVHHGNIAVNTQFYFAHDAVVRCTGSDYITATAGFGTATNVLLAGGATENDVQTRISVTWLGQVS
jgi:hypothetical protein